MDAKLVAKSRILIKVAPKMVAVMVNWTKIVVDITEDTTSYNLEEKRT